MKLIKLDKKNHSHRRFGGFVSYFRTYEYSHVSLSAIHQKMREHLYAQPSCLFNIGRCGYFYSSFNRPIAHDVTAPVTMHLEDKLAICA